MSGPHLRTCVLLQFGLYSTTWSGLGGSLAKQTSPPPLGLGYQLVAPRGASSPGPRLAHTSALPGTSSGRRGRAALLTKYSTAPGQLPPGWLILTFVIPGSLFLCSRSRCMRQGAKAAQHPLPLPAAALLHLRAAGMRWSKWCWGRTAKRELRFGPTPSFPAPFRKDLARWSRRPRCTT